MLLILWNMGWLVCGAALVIDLTRPRYHRVASSSFRQLMITRHA